MSNMNQGQSSPNHLTMQPLDPLTFPLTGSSLIEASAGTGKTYTIVNLYLRLLLGRGRAPLSVDKILVVTFTNAATGELKERIRQRLREAYLAFFAQSSEDPFIQNLIEQAQDIKQDCQRLALASKQMDEAAVYTIHGFSQKVLTEHAFESGAMFQQGFILDESEWLQLAVEDYWRKHVVGLSAYYLQMILSVWAQPSALLSIVRPFIYRKTHFKNNVSIDKSYQLLDDYHRLVVKAKTWWLSENVAEQLGKAKLKGNVKLGKWNNLQKMTQFCQSNFFIPNMDNLTWADFTPAKVESSKSKSNSADISHLDFSIFEHLVDALDKCQNAIKLCFNHQAIEFVKRNLSDHKMRLQLLSPDDLLQGLNQALTKGSQGENPLAVKLAKAYPAALIDEFQDTDPIQFETFKQIYAPFNNLVNSVSSEHNESEASLCWIMIGDPKQAIYGFRGADIYTYIGAKQWVDKGRHFTLATNWRSSPKLISGINRLFASSGNGFLFEDSIPFYPVKAGRDYAGLSINKQQIAPLHFEHVQAKNGLSVKSSEAREALAHHCAGQIASWLNLAQMGMASHADKEISAGDICVLVRDRVEAKLVKQALFTLNIASVFLTRQNVFETQVAQDLYRLLKALSHPNEEKLFKTALMSELFGFTALELDDIFNDELRWQGILDSRLSWYHGWQKYGLMHTLNRVFQYFQIEEKLLQLHADGYRRITDLRHLVELLQQQSLKLVGESQLIHWFETCILSPEPNNESQQLRIESDGNLVQIVTFHASKGLEFPLVFIPFAASFKANKECVYHNQAQQLEVDFLQSDEAKFQAEYERLAEDIRLFYVAVTRAVHYCYIGLWNTSLGKSTKKSSFSQTALGNLLLAESSPSEAEINGAISDEHIRQGIENILFEGEVSYAELSDTEQVYPPFKAKSASIEPIGDCLQLNQKIQRTWQLTSYSAISRQQAHADIPQPGLDEGHIIDAKPVEPLHIHNVAKNAFTFEKGANAGSFLHGVLENIDFQQPTALIDAVKTQGTWFGISEDWHQAVVDWLTDVLVSKILLPESSQMFSLSMLSTQAIKVEMEFHMPLKSVEVNSFNHVINHFSPEQYRDYQFDTLNGMIKGFIDLMFEYDGKFYVADYKSNYLGDNLESYSQSAMEQGMREHDYHLQGILYTLALHRWLKTRMVDYHFETHVGGAYYLFLRGMSTKINGNGAYYFKPNAQLIYALDDLFDGNEVNLKPTTHIQTESNLNTSDGQLGLWS